MYGVNASANDVQDGRKKVEYLCCAHGIRYPYWRDGLGLLEAHGGRRTRVYGGNTRIETRSARGDQMSVGIHRQHDGRMPHLVLRGDGSLTRPHGFEI